MSPTYDYRCKKCGYEFEKFQNISDPKVKICPKCGGNVERLISGGSGIIFKGSGFYTTDYKKKEQSMKRDVNPDTSLPKKSSSSSGSDKQGSSAKSKNGDS